MTKSHLVGASLLALIIAGPAAGQTAPAQAPSTPAAQPADTPTTSDDIIVTATKREQTLQDVPISVSVTDQRTVERAQIRDIIDIQSIVPSLKVTQLNAVGQTNFIIRGFGNGNGNDGIEASVGVFIDGVYRSRTSSALDDLPEIERVEVLRGPQSTLFGKNVSAGAISIVTRKPQFDFGGKAEVSIGNYGLINPRLTVTGPISSTVAVRLSGSVNERDGYFNNLVTKNDINDRNRWSVRADVLWQPSADFSVRVIGDYNLIREKCCGVTQILNGPRTQLIGAPKPTGLGAAIGDTTRVFDRNIIFNTDPTNRLVGKGISGQVDWDVGFARLTSITAYREQVSQSVQDVDFVGADIASKVDGNNIRTFTQEFRLASTGNGPFNWLVGGFYQDEKLQTGRDINYGIDIRAYADRLSGGNITTLETLQGLVTPSIVAGKTYFQAGNAIQDNYRLNQQSFSLFGQADYKLTDRLTLTGGVAYLNDRKATQSFVVLNDPFSKLDLQNVPQFAFLPLQILNPAAPAGAKIPGNLFGALGALQFYYGNTANHAPVNLPNATESGILKGDKVTYALRAAYDFGFINAYVSYSTGWKAGAYNLSSDGRPPDANGIGRSAKPESVTVYEAGLKAKFRGGFFNLAVFKQSITDFQLNTFTGIGYSLVNAGKQSVKGFEVDAAYKPVPWLALTGAVTYLDPKYDSFLRAPCVNYDSVRCPVNPATGQRPVFRDLSGAKPAGVPEWSASASATVSHQLSGDISGYVRGEFDFTSNTYLTESTPPDISTWGQSTFNASIGLASAVAKLEIMVWARNLTNDNFLIGTFPTVAQDGSYSGYPNAPRTYGVTVRKSF